MHSVFHVVISGHVHVDQLEEGRAFDPQPLGSFWRGVEAARENVEPEGVEVLGELVADPGVAARDQDRLGPDLEASLAHHAPEEVGQEAGNHGADNGQLEEDEPDVIHAYTLLDFSLALTESYLIRHIPLWTKIRFQTKSLGC